MLYLLGIVLYLLGMVLLTVSHVGTFQLVLLFYWCSSLPLLSDDEKEAVELSLKPCRYSGVDFQYLIELIIKVFTKRKLLSRECISLRAHAHTRTHARTHLSLIHISEPTRLA